VQQLVKHFRITEWTDEEIIHQTQQIAETTDMVHSFNHGSGQNILNIYVDDLRRWVWPRPAARSGPVDNGRVLFVNIGFIITLKSFLVVCMHNSRRFIVHASSSSPGRAFLCVRRIPKKNA
jgi:hypothetical protein